MLAEIIAYILSGLGQRLALPLCPSELVADEPPAAAIQDPHALRYGLGQQAASRTISFRQIIGRIRPTRVTLELEPQFSHRQKRGPSAMYCQRYCPSDKTKLHSQGH